MYEFDIEKAKDEYKSWTETFPGHKDQLIARRFEKGQVISIDDLSFLSNILSDFFRNKSLTFYCEFVLIPTSKGYDLELIEASDECYVEASIYSIPCKEFTQSLERLGIKEPICLTAQSLGFAWRTDKEPIMELFDILFELNDSSLE
jgi:hypothetical protein